MLLQQPCRLRTKVGTDVYKYARRFGEKKVGDSGYINVRRLVTMMMCCPESGEACECERAKPLSHMPRHDADARGRIIHAPGAHSSLES